VDSEHTKRMLSLFEISKMTYFYSGLLSMNLAYINLLMIINLTLPAGILLGHPGSLKRIKT
jgi:hypothetical protein